MPDGSHTELELKLRLLDPTAWGSVLSAPILADLQAPATQLERLEAKYFDTHDQALQKAGVAYRIRMENDRWVATVKAGGTSAGGLHERREWNIVVTEPEPNMEYFRDTEAWPLLQDILGEGSLTALFSTAFDRRKVEIATTDGSLIELAVDIGLIIAGERQEPIAEVELELKSGSSAAVLALGAELARSVPLTVEPRSKYFRGLQLAGLVEHEAPVKQPGGTVDLDADAVSALRSLLFNRIHQVFMTQAEFLQNTTDPEALHQFRIQIRRLRSLLSFAKPLIELDSYTKWQEELKAWSHNTNALREMDVIMETWQDIIGDGELALSPPPWLGIMLHTERSNLARQLADTLSQGQSTPQLLGLWAWLAEYASWANVENPALSEFAVPRLIDWVGTMRDMAKDLSLDNSVSLHQLRILGKKLRYSLEDLQLKDRKTKYLLGRLKLLQGCVGDIRDARSITDTLTAWMNTQASRLLHRDSGILLGWTARTSRDAQQNFERTLRRFRRAAKRWLRGIE